MRRKSPKAAAAAITAAGAAVILLLIAGAALRMHTRGLGFLDALGSFVRDTFRAGA